MPAYTFRNKILFSVLILLLVLFSASLTYAGNPAAPIQPGDNIQDPGDPGTAWGGCGPSDSNCYVTTTGSQWTTSGSDIYYSGGNVGIGDTTPLALLTVGNGDLFRVTSGGAISAATGLTSSGTITFSGLSSTGVVHNNSSGVLSTSLVALGDLLTQGTATDEFCLTSETGGGALLAWQSCGSGGVTDADYGDITVASGVWTIDNNVVSDAKLRQSAGLSIIGRSANSTGNVADITGTADQVLRINSAGTALAFGAIDVSQSAAVTGTLRLGNGGTGTNTTFTQGSVVFAGASGIYTQDNASLFFNDSTNRLGIGTTSPTDNLHIHDTSDNQAIHLTGTATGAGFGDGIKLQVSGTLDAQLKNFENGFLAFSTNGAEVMRLSAAGNVTIGTASAGGRLTVKSAGTDTSVQSFVSSDGDGLASLYEMGDTGSMLNLYNSSGTGVITFRTDNDNSYINTGRFGIGDTTPVSLFTVGSGDLFQVNSSGAVAAATGITSSGTITFSGLSSTGVVHNNSSGVLSTSLVALGDLLTQGTATDEFCLTSETGGGALLAWQTCSSASGNVNSGVSGKATYYPSTGTTVDDFAGVDYATSGTNVTMTAQNAADVILKLKLAGSATGNFLEFRDSSDNLLTAFSKQGGLILRGTTGTPGVAGIGIGYDPNNDTGNISVYSSGYKPMTYDALNHTFDAGASGNRAMYIDSNGKIAVGMTGSPTALLHIVTGGTTAAGTAPLKLTSGTNLTTPEAGAMEWNGTNLFITQTTGPTRKTLAYTTDITNTLYTGDGALTSNRTVDLNGKQLFFKQGANSFLRLDPSVNGEGVYLQALNTTGSSNVGGFSGTTSATTGDFAVAAAYQGTNLAYISGHSDATEGTLTYSADTHAFTGNVGIGATPTYAELDVRGTNVSISGNSQTPGAETRLYVTPLPADNFADQAKIAIISEANGSWGRGKLHFAINNSANDDNATKADAILTIDPTGLVGIGTTTPDYKLQVAGAISLEGSRSDTLEMCCVPDIAANYLVVGKGAYWGLRQSTTNSINFDVYNGGTEKAALSILQNGYVGVGFEPDSQFQVYDDVSGAGLRIGYNSTAFNYYNANTHIFRDTANAEAMRITGGKVGIGASSPGSTLQIGDGSQDPIQLKMWSGGTTSLRIDNGNRYWDITNNGGSDLSFTDVTGTVTPLVLEAGGNVGIGDTNPDYLLDVENTGTDGNIFSLHDSDGECLYNPESGAVTVSCSSDERLKTNITDSGSALAYLNTFRIRDYDVIASGDHMTGVIAQEVLQTHPELVNIGSSGMYSVQLPNEWEFVKAIQELDLKIKNIENLEDSGDNSFVAKLQRWFGNISNGIEEFIAGRIKARQEICINNTCINEAQLQQIIQQNGTTNTPPPQSPPPSAPEGDQPPIETLPPSETLPSNTPPNDTPPAPPSETPSETPADTATPAPDLPTEQPDAPPPSPPENLTQ